MMGKAHMVAPLQITLYGPGDEEKGTYTKQVVSWGLLKRAIRLSEEMNAAENQSQVTEPTDWPARFQRWLHRNDRPISGEEQMIDRLSEFVVDVFDGQFTVKDLDDGAEISEIMAVMQSIVSRAKTMVPTKPPTTRKRH